MFRINAMRMTPGNVSEETLTGSKTLVVTDDPIQRLDPGGSSRTVNLPDVTLSTGLSFAIFNAADDNEWLTVHDGGGAVCVVYQGEIALVVCDGTDWYAFVGRANVSPTNRTMYAGTVVAALTTTLITNSGEIWNSAGAATAAVAERFGKTRTEGMEIRVVDEVVTLTNAVETNLTNTVPAGAVILSVQGNLDTAVTGDGSGDNLGEKVGIGITAAPAKYGVSADLAKNTKIDTVPDWAVLSGAETVCVKFVKADGSTACTEKFTAGGKVRVRIVYLANNSLDDAA